MGASFDAANGFANAYQGFAVFLVQGTNKFILSKLKEGSNFVNEWKRTKLF